MRANLGRMQVEVAGDGPEVSYLRDEFKPVQRLDGTESASLRLHVARSPLPELGSAVRHGRTFVGDGWCRVESPGPPHLVRWDGDVLDVDICSKMLDATRLPDLAQKMRNWNHLTRAEWFAKDVMYAVFDHLSQIRQLALRQTYVHASAVEREGRAVLFPAWGGVGKTSSMLRLVMGHGWRFLADDLAIIDDDGRVHRHPKRMQVYAYNLADDPEMARSFMAGRPLLDRAMWRINLSRRGPSGVRRRIHPEEFLGEGAAGSEGTISDVVVLQRTTNQTFTLEEPTLGEVSDRLTWTLLTELRPFATRSAEVHAAGGPVPIPTIPQMISQTRAVLGDALAGARLAVLTVPSETPPSVLADRLLDHIG